jgi:hypothetical protein
MVAGRDVAPRPTLTTGRRDLLLAPGRAEAGGGGRARRLRRAGGRCGGPLESPASLCLSAGRHATYLPAPRRRGPSRPCPRRSLMSVSQPSSSRPAHSPRKQQPLPTEPPASWLTVAQAAACLAMSADALRRALERRAVRAPDGGVEASWDGVRARKLGRLWRVLLSARWHAADGEVTSALRGGARDDREGNRP